MSELAQSGEDVSRETLQSEHQYYLGKISNDLVATAKDTAVDIAPFTSVSSEALSIYPVVDSVAWIQRLLALGVKTVQLRIKDSAYSGLEEDIQTAIQLGREFNAQVFINDYWQMAVKHGAYGIHLGQEDLETADLDQIRTAGIRLGVSTHGYEEMLRAARIKPSYIALGHVFPTTTKQMPSQPQGLTRLAMYQSWVDAMNDELGTDIPTVAIGGIDLSNAADVLKCGVTSLAVVRAVTLADNTQQALESFRYVFQEINSPEKGA
jgi:thiamine-phosphate pyrophosphorylase